MQRTFEALDWVVLLTYFVVVVGVGLYLSRYVKKTEDFFKCSGRMPWWLAGISSYVGYTSCFVFVVYGQMAYQHGLVALFAMGSGVFGFTLAALFFAKKWRRASIMTPVEYLETRYNNTIRQLFAIGTIPYRVIDDALKVLTLSVFLSLVTNVRIDLMIGVAGIIVLAYCITGGLLSVLITDLIQFTVKMMALLLLFAYTMTPHYLSGFADSLRAPDGVIHLFATPGDPQNKVTLSYWLVLVLVVTMTGNMGWAIVQRYLCVKSDSDAPKVAWTLVFLNIAMPILILLPIMIGRQILPNLTNEESRAIYMRLCMVLLPAGGLGLVLAAMFSSAMTSLAAEYTVLGSVMTHDVYRRLIYKKGTDHHYLTTARILTGTTAMITISVSLIVVHSEKSIFEWMARAAGLFVPPMAIPFLGGLLWKRPSAKAAMTAYIVGLGYGLLLFAAENTLLHGRNGPNGLAALIQDLPIVKYWITNSFEFSTLSSFALSLSAFVIAGHCFQPEHEEDLRRKKLYERLSGTAAGVTEPPSLHAQQKLEAA